MISLLIIGSPCLVAAARVLLICMLGFAVSGFVIPLPLGRSESSSSLLKAQGSPTLENFGLQRKDPEGSVLGLTENQGAYLPGDRFKMLGSLHRCSS